MPKRKILDFLIIYFLFLFVNTFPVNQISKILWVRLLIYSVLNIALLLFIYFFVKKKSYLVTYQHAPVWKNLWILLPLILVGASNFLYVAFAPGDVTASLDSKFPLYLLLTLFTVLKEETIFRLLLIPNLDFVKKRFWRIILSAGIFGLAHFSNYLVTLDPSYFIQMVYTFGFGIILGFVYEYGRSWVTCMIFHFFFNTINGTIFEKIAPEISNYPLYIIANIIVSAVAGLYLLIIYLCVLRKQQSGVDILPARRV